MPLYRDVLPGDEFRIGNVSIRVEQKTGQRVRLRIDGAPDIVHIKRRDKPAAQPTLVDRRTTSSDQAPPPAAPQATSEAPKPRLRMPQFPISA